MKKHGVCLTVFLFVFLTAGCSRESGRVFVDSSGVNHPLQDNRGRWTVLNVWALWCSYCRDEVSVLNSLARQGRIRVLGYDFDQEAGDRLRRKIHTMGIGFPVVAENPMPLIGAPLPSSLPANLVLDPEGRLVKTLYGVQSVASLTREIDALAKGRKYE